MIILSPNSDTQEFNIIPRNRESFNSLTLTITDESSKEFESFDNVDAYDNGNYVLISQAFSILKENRLYKLVITQDGGNWWRGKVRCTSQDNYKQKHSLNTIASTQYVVIENDETFTILP